MLFSIWPKRPFFDRLYHDRRCPTSGFGNRMTFSNNPEKLSLFGRGCNENDRILDLYGGLHVSPAKYMTSGRVEFPTLKHFKCWLFFSEVQRIQSDRVSLHAQHACPNQLAGYQYYGSSQQNYHVANRESRFLEPLSLSLWFCISSLTWWCSSTVLLACWSLVLAPNNGTRSSSKVPFLKSRPVLSRPPSTLTHNLLFFFRYFLGQSLRTCIRFEIFRFWDIFAELPASWLASARKRNPYVSGEVSRPRGLRGTRLYTSATCLGLVPAHRFPPRQDPLVAISNSESTRAIAMVVTLAWCQLHFPFSWQIFRQKFPTWTE